MKNEQVRLIPRELREADFPSARFLSEEEQTKYEEACKRSNFLEKAKEVLNIRRKGSNLFKVLFLNQIGIKTASLGELESALENGLCLQGQYEDASAVVLRSAGDSYSDNDYIARSLADSLGVQKITSPLVVIGLEIVADDKSKYGLNLKRTEKTQVVDAPSLGHENHQRKFLRINPDYSIDFNDNGNRTLWTRDNGISRLYLGRDLDLYSRYEYLADSNDVGRVVIVSSGEAGAKNFEQYVSQLNAERQRQIADVELRYTNAMNVLKGE
ncbi:hypothetical protein J4218_02045 [Candidatus Pacearchaeota archaeon]|nr:hypothetical protein [uncultured archaeon]AQS29133.1 hypothetical protein [uncultured archaeon]MBS3078879.1 hypothetical protein [Candidatus Pacearchaeota archaeon]